MHGLAMQPYTKGLAHDRLTASVLPVRIKDWSYRADLATGEYILNV